MSHSQFKCNIALHAWALSSTCASECAEHALTGLCLVVWSISGDRRRPTAQHSAAQHSTVCTAVAHVLIQVNPVREKKLTNVRNTGSEEKVSLSPPRLFTLEDAIGRLCYKG